jgi:hypothetical protein
MPTQTDEQRNRALTDAGYTPGTFSPGTTPANPVSRTVDAPAADPNASAAEMFLGTFKAPETAAQIAERKRQQSAGLIDSINKTYDDQVASSRKAGDERVAMDNAVSVLSGLTGSTEAVRTRTNVNAANDKELAAINNKRMLDLSKVYTDISNSADEEARQQVQDATKSAEDIVARRAQSQAKALDSIKTMAAGGLVDFDSFKQSPQNKKVFEYALQAAGSEDALRSLFAVNRPKDQIVGTPTRIGNAYVQAYQNPITGQVKYEQIALPFDLPETYSKFEKMGDNLVAMPDNWDGDVTKLRTVAGSPSITEQLQRQSLALDIQKKQSELLVSGGDTQKTQATIDLVKSALTDAKQLAGASGRSGARKSLESWFVGSTDYTNLVAQTNTLKTNVLTLIGDPTIKKFFGPQMSNADVTLMTSAGTTLNPELQSPEKLKNELLRLEDLIGRMDKAVSSGAAATGRASSIVTAPDGTQVEIID